MIVYATALLSSKISIGSISYKSLSALECLFIMKKGYCFISTNLLNFIRHICVVLSQFRMNVILLNAPFITSPYGLKEVDAFFNGYGGLCLVMSGLSLTRDA